MKAFSVLIIAVALSAGVAHAQVPAGLGVVPSGTRDMAENGDMSARRMDNAKAAFNAKNFVVAEGLFDDVLRHNPNSVEANFMMGVTKMSLDKWPEAKTYLEIAVKKNPKAPDPRSRLGVTLAKLGDIEGAKAQRAELVKMKNQCRGNCREAQWIDAGLSMMDAVLPRQ